MHGEDMICEGRITEGAAPEVATAHRLAAEAAATLPAVQVFKASLHFIPCSTCLRSSLMVKDEDDYEQRR